MESERPRLKPRRFLLLAISLLFVLAVPVFLVTESVTWAVNDLRLYRHGFTKYAISDNTRITDDDLMGAARQIRSYFNSSREPLVVMTKVNGVERNIFNPREVAHMRDVKGLIRGVYETAAVSGAFLFLVGLIWSAISADKARIHLPRLLLLGSGLTLALLLLAGLLVFSGFDRAFLIFHQLGFTNDLWQLEPGRDYLVTMFPQGFWFDATMFVALSTAVQALVLGAVSGGVILWGRWRGSSSASVRIEPVTKA